MVLVLVISDPNPSPQPGPPHSPPVDNGCSGFVELHQTGQYTAVSRGQPPSQCDPSSLRAEQAGEVKWVSGESK